MNDALHEGRVGALAGHGTLEGSHTLCLYQRGSRSQCCSADRIQVVAKLQTRHRFLRSLHEEGFTQIQKWFSSPSCC